MKKYLIINHHAPIEHLYTEEVLELILSIASLDKQISVLLLQTSSLILLDQKYELTERILLKKTLEAFNLFALEDIYVEQNVLTQLNSLGLNLHNLKKIKPFSWNNLNNLYTNHDIILSF